MPTKLKDRPRYIFLEVGDTIKKNDELWDNYENWCQVNSDMVHTKTEPLELIRRKVNND